MWCAALHACFFLFGSAPDYQQLLAAVQIPVVKRIEDATAIVVPAGTAVDPQQIVARVEQGALLITERDSPLARKLGLAFDGREVEVTQVEDALNPRVAVVWEKPVKIVAPSLPANAKVLVKEKWSGAPLMILFPYGKGRVLFLAAELQGYSRFPYFVHALMTECQVTPPFRNPRLHAFFDYGYRTGVDLDYFAQRWRRQGVVALHVSAWQFWDRGKDRDEYLAKLIAACHRNGVLVYAWFEFPHVSEKVWQDHPNWREKTATLADAHLDWRALINLLDPAAFEAVSKGLKSLLADFDWDGVNLSEVYFESPQGPENAQRFTPMNDNVRREFRKEAGFDPIELFNDTRNWKTHPSDWQKFVEYRASVVERLHVAILDQLPRRAMPHLDVAVTFVDNLYDEHMKEALGADVRRMQSLQKRYPFTLIIEDPATLWALGPERYQVLGQKYDRNTAIDINIVDRYQEVFPTKKQTGGEFLQLFHNAAASFSMVLAYFEASIFPRDLDVVSYALAAGAQVADDGAVSSARPVSFHTNAAIVDGQPWPARTGDEVMLPAGTHRVTEGQAPGFRLSHFTGELLTASYGDTHTINFTYRSGPRAIAIFSPPPHLITVDGAAISPGGDSVILPSGEHRVQALQ